MTEHLDINLVAWPHNRAARRALAKQLGFTGVAAERAYKAQKEALKPKRGRPRKVAQDDLPTADFVGDRPPPVSVVVKDASERKAPQVQVLIDGKPAEFVTQWAASVEDLEHAYMQNVREGGKPVYVHAQNMGGLTFHEDLSAKGPDGAPVRVGTLLKPAEVATLRDEVSHTLELREALRTQTDALEKCKEELKRAWAKVDAAGPHIVALERLIAHLMKKRDVWSGYMLLWVGFDAIDAWFQGRPLLASVCAVLVAILAAARRHDRKEDREDAPAPGAWLNPEPTKAQTICTDDLCNCPKEPCDQPDVCGCDGFVADDAHTAGCGHAPSSPFNVPGVLPETPQVVVGDNDKEG